MDLDERARFEQIVLPHLDAAFNLARWMLRSRADAEDVAQEALLRAYRFFGGFHGGRIVRRKIWNLTKRITERN
jgi:RNA polymerase sigma-70 factor, ECF subfamily